MAGIRVLRWSHDQTAIGTSFAHEKPHDNVCVELHRASGPFTLVPLPNGRSSLVWVERRAEAARLAALPAAAFACEVERVSRRALGRVFDVAERACFPLMGLIAREVGKNRVVLLGEAAHVAPPIGAQGLNLGFRDVAALVELAKEARANGEDIGGDHLLRRYSAARRADMVTRTLGADMLNRSLLSGFLPLSPARGAGLYALGAIGPLRRAVMRRGIA
jgi:2-octaprenyl-6-methoxyphenol hydroxylase